MTDKFIAEMQKRADKKRFTEALIKIQKNQQVIYGRINESTTGIEEEHRKMLVELLGDYKQLFERKISMVDRHDNELGRLTTQLDAKVKSYNKQIAKLKKAISEANVQRKIFNVQTKKLNDEILRYNGLVIELNEKILGLQGGEKKW